MLVLKRQKAATTLVTVCLSYLVQMSQLKTAYFIALYVKFKDCIETFVYKNLLKVLGHFKVDFYSSCTGFVVTTHLEGNADFQCKLYKKCGFLVQNSSLVTYGKHII